MSTPAEERAARDNLPIVAVTAFQLLRAAEGNPMIVGTLDGGEVLLRLWTAAEFMAAHVAAVQALPEFARPPIMSAPECARLVAPIEFGGA